ncbi:MAG TPA: hypothetical protein VNV43_06115 [Candidatus Acidoferrales bacterium]|nr:hypothetical protein [Candidatus Acidoferrales bacterium]
MRRVLGIGLVAMLLYGQGAVGSSRDESAASLTAGQIFEKMLGHYASLASYQDQGSITTTIGGTIIAIGFETRMARPDFYRIEWDQLSKLAYSTEDSGMQGAWSFESGDYLQTPSGLQKQYSRDVAFANMASASSEGVAMVPRIFFGVHGIGEPGAIIDLARLPDDKVGNIECFQITGETAAGGTNTFWVGKRDFLIRQIRTDFGPGAMQSAFTGATKGQVEPPFKLNGFSSIEIYTNVVANKRFSRRDFVPSFSLSGPY